MLEISTGNLFVRLKCVVFEFAKPLGTTQKREEVYFFLCSSADLSGAFPAKNKLNHCAIHSPACLCDRLTHFQNAPPFAHRSLCARSPTAARPRSRTRCCSKFWTTTAMLTTRAFTTSRCLGMQRSMVNTWRMMTMTLDDARAAALRVALPSLLPCKLHTTASAPHCQHQHPSPSLNSIMRIQRSNISQALCHVVWLSPCCCSPSVIKCCNAC